MGNYSGADLSSSAPLSAREKVRGGKHSVLCGVLTCPETLATREGWSVEIAAGYELGKNRILLKTRRAGARQGGHRDGVKEHVKPQYEEVLSACRAQHANLINPKRNQLLHNPDHVPPSEDFPLGASDEDYHVATNIWNMRLWYRGAERARKPNSGYFLEFDQLPVTIRCGRCGRLSKIAEAKQRP